MAMLWFWPAVCARGGILIFDQMSSRMVQRIPFELDGELRLFSARDMI